MATSIVSNSTAATFGNSPQKTGEPLDHATLYSGKALEFDGVGDYLDTGTTLEDWVNQDDKTMSLWVYNAGNTSEARIFNAGKTGSSTAFALGMDAGSTDNKPFYFLRNTSAAALKTEFGEVQPVGTWYYYVIVQDTSENEAYIYQNGVLVSTVSSVGVITQSTTTTAKIGVAWYNTALYPFNGALSNLQLWNKTWSTSDVQYAYTNPESLITDNASVTAGITTSDLKLWYPMNDTGVRSPQTVIFDAAGTNNTTKNHATTTFLGDELNTEANALTPTGSSASEANDISTWSNNDQGGSASSESVVADKGATGSYAMNIQVAGAGRGVYIDLEGSPYSLTTGRSYRITWDWRYKTAHTNVFLATFSSATDGTTNATTAATLTGDGSDQDFEGESYDFVKSANFRYFHIKHSSGTQFSTDVRVDNLSIKEIGTATGWTDADQQGTIPQTALMDGSVKAIFNYPTIDDEYIDLNYGNAYNPYDNGLTVSFWAFPFVITGNQMAMGAPWAGDTRAYIGFGGDSKWGLGVRDKTWDTAVATGSEPSATVNAWVFISVTFNAGTATLYHNGSAAFTQTYTSYALNSDFYLGAGTSSTYEFQGILDEASIFSTSLSAAQVTALYNSGTPLNATKSAAASSLVGYWRNNALTSAGTWEDLSTNDNHGTVHVGDADKAFFQEGIQANLDTQGMNTTIDHPGGGAVYFGGVADYIDLGKTIIIEGEFTLEMWIKTGDFTNNRFCGLDATDYQSINTSTKFRMKLDGTQKSIDINDVGDHATDTLLVNEWFHFALTRSSANLLTIYVNGTAQSDTEADVDDKFQVRYFGTDDASTNFFKGWLDEVRLYHKGLTAAEVKKNYNHGKGKHSN